MCAEVYGLVFYFEFDPVVFVLCVSDTCYDWNPVQNVVPVIVCSSEPFDIEPNVFHVEFSMADDTYAAFVINNIVFKGHGTVSIGFSGCK